MTRVFNNPFTAGAFSPLINPGAVASGPGADLTAGYTAEQGGLISSAYPGISNALKDGVGRYLKNSRNWLARKVIEPHAELLGRLSSHSEQLMMLGAAFALHTINGMAAGTAMGASEILSGALPPMVVADTKVTPSENLRALREKYREVENILEELDRETKNILSKPRSERDPDAFHELRRGVRRDFLDVAKDILVLVASTPDARDTRFFDLIARVFACVTNPTTYVMCDNALNILKKNLQKFGLISQDGLEWTGLTNEEISSLYHLLLMDCNLTEIVSLFPSLHKIADAGELMELIGNTPPIFLDKVSAKPEEGDHRDDLPALRTRLASLMERQGLAPWVVEVLGEIDAYLKRLEATSGEVCSKDAGFPKWVIQGLEKAITDESGISFGGERALEDGDELRQSWLRFLSYITAATTYSESEVEDMEALAEEVMSYISLDRDEYLEHMEEFLEPEEEERRVDAYIFHDITSLCSNISALPEPWRKIAYIRSTIEIDHPNLDIKMAVIEITKTVGLALPPDQRAPYIEFLVRHASATDLEDEDYVRTAAAISGLLHGIDGEYIKDVLKRTEIIANSVKLASSQGTFTWGFGLMDMTLPFLTPEDIEHLEIGLLEKAADLSEEGKKLYIRHLISFWGHMSNGTKKMLGSDKGMLAFVLDSIDEYRKNIGDLLKIYSLHADKKHLTSIRSHLWKNIRHPSMQTTSIRSRLWKNIRHSPMQTKNLYLLSQLGLNVLLPKQRSELPQLLLTHMIEHPAAEAAIKVTSDAIYNFYGNAPDPQREEMRKYILDRIDTPVIRLRISRLRPSYGFLQLLSLLSDKIAQWQSFDTLEVFIKAAGLENSAFVKFISAQNQIPKSHILVLKDTLMSLLTDDDLQKILVRQLLNGVNSRGELEQLVNFFRSYITLTSDVRNEFVWEVAEETMRTLKGKTLLTDEGDHKLLIKPTRALARLNIFLANKFIDGLEMTGHQKSKASAAISALSDLWNRSGLMSHISSLQSISGRTGRKAITNLVQDLTSDAAVKATREAGSARILNPGRYKGLEDVFPEDFIRKWARDDKDLLIPLGDLESGSVLKNDPLALKKSRYDYAFLQIGAHLDISGISGMAHATIAGHLIARIKQWVSGAEGFDAWRKEMVKMFATMMSLGDLGGEKMDEIVSFAAQHEERLKNDIGPEISEFLNDLRELKKGLTATAIEGKAYLVISSDPATFLKLGKFPIITCQDPTRRTGHNSSGEPVNRIADGRFRYALVVIDKDIRYENGLVKLGKDAKWLARAHLEVTTDSGERTPTEHPKLLVERLYPAPGFIYGHTVDEALRERFARDELGLDPDKDVDNAFAGRRLSLRPLPDNGLLYRDTHRR